MFDFFGKPLAWTGKPVDFGKKFIGFEKKKWQPSGVPTITNLIEDLDKSGWNIELYFTDFSSNKDSGLANENEYNYKKHNIISTSTYT